MKIERFEEIKAFIAGVVTSFVFYAAIFFITPHLLYLRHPRLFVLGFFAAFFLAGAISSSLRAKRSNPAFKTRLLRALRALAMTKGDRALAMMSGRPHSFRNDKIFRIAGLAVMALSVAAIIKMGAVKEFLERILYGWRYFLILPEYARNFSADCLLLAAVTALPAFLLGGTLFPGRKNKFISFFAGIMISGLIIVNFLPAHRYEFVEKLPQTFLEKDGRVIMDNRLSSIAAERLKVYLPFILGGGVKSALFVGLGSTEALKAAEGIPSIGKIVCLETDRRYKTKDGRIKIVRHGLKRYLSSSTDKFDLIVINSEDFPLKKNADSIRKHLADGGFLAAALPLNKGDTYGLKKTMAEYRAFFGEATVWMPHQTVPSRLLVLCRKEKLGLEMKSLKEIGERIAKDESMLRELSSINVDSIFDLLDMLVFSEEGLAAYAQPDKEAHRGREGEPILRKLTEPAAREVNIFHRDNSIDIIRARNSPLELFKGEVPENARKTIKMYYDATMNTVLGQIYKDINGFSALGELEFRTALKVNPLDRNAAYALGIPEKFGSLIANTRARFTPATEDIIKGKTLLMEDDDKGAVEKFKEAVKKDPENELARAHLANVYQMTGKPDKALGEYKAIISRAGEFNPPPINAESVEAIAVYRALGEVAIGIYYWDKGMMKEFMRSVKGVIGLGHDPGHVFPPYITDSPVFKRNLAYLKAKMTKAPDEDIAREILGGYYSSMGHIYWLRGMYLKAVIYANGALLTTKMSDLREMIYSDLGTYFAEVGELESAEEYYKKALAINPNIPQVNKYLKINSLELKRKKGPVTAELLLELAQSYKDIFDLGKNARYLEEALALDKNSAELKFKYDEAVLQRMLSLNPDDSYGHNALGVLYWSNNEPYKAIGSFMASLEINPYFADAHFNLAMAYRDAGDKKNEAKHLKKALKFKPDMAIARQELGKIKEIASSDNTKTISSSQ